MYFGKDKKVTYFCNSEYGHFSLRAAVEIHSIVYITVVLCNIFRYTPCDFIQNCHETFKFLIKVITWSVWISLAYLLLVEKLNTIEMSYFCYLLTYFNQNIYHKIHHQY